MSKHIKFTNGILTARFDSAINAVMPTDAIEVSEAVFYQTINELDGIWQLENGNVVKKPFPAPTLADLKTAKNAEITQSFNATMQQVVGGAPSYEIDSWSEQKAEALAFSANALSVTPLIDSMATARGVPKAALAARIIAKAGFFAGISGQLIGKRQGLEDSIEAATSKTALAAIIW